MKCNYIISTAMVWALMGPAALQLNAANVSIVNQSSPSSSTPSSTSPTLGTGLNNQANQSQSSGKGSAGSIVGKLPPSKGAASKRSAARISKSEDTQLSQYSEEPVYTYPGLLAKIGNRWVGSDYLYDLHRNIGVVIEVVQSEGKEIPIDKAVLKEIVSEIFSGADLMPEAMASATTPPLPFFHILIFALPTDSGNVAFISGRLFEDALLARYGLDPLGTWQAISWEKQELLVASAFQFDEKLKSTVADIAKTFVERVEMYAKIKEESQSDVKLYFPKVIPEPKRNH